jgi:hypothetical protein
MVIADEARFENIHSVDHPEVPQGHRVNKPGLRHPGQLA